MMGRDVKGVMGVYCDGGVLFVVGVYTQLRTVTLWVNYYTLHAL